MVLQNGGWKNNDKTLFPHVTKRHYVAQKPKLYILVLFLFILFIYFFWSMVDLQCCVSFRYTKKWFSYTYINMSFFFGFFSFKAIESWKVFSCMNLHSWTPAMPMKRICLGQTTQLRRRMEVTGSRTEPPQPRPPQISSPQLTPGSYRCLGEPSWDQQYWADNQHTCELNKCIFVCSWSFCGCSMCSNTVTLVIWNNY